MKKCTHRIRFGFCLFTLHEVSIKKSIKIISVVYIFWGVAFIRRWVRNTKHTQALLNIWTFFEGWLVYSFSSSWEMWHEKKLWKLHCINISVKFLFMSLNSSAAQYILLLLPSKNKRRENRVVSLHNLWAQFSIIRGDEKKNKKRHEKSQISLNYILHYILLQDTRTWVTTWKC